MRNAKNWTFVDINGVMFSKRPTKVGKGKDAKLVGYAQVPQLPDGSKEQPFTEADAQAMLLEWLESGVLGYKQTLTATVNALAVQTQAAVRRRYESAVNGKHTEDQLFNIGFASMPKDELVALMSSASDPKAARAAIIAKGRQFTSTGLETEEALRDFAEQNVVTSDNTMSTEDDDSSE